MNKIKVGDFKTGNEERTAINKVLDSGRISEYKNVAMFEKEWAQYIGTKHCIAVNSGTSALMAGLMALKYKYNLGANNKVITTPITYIATSNAIVNSGYEPVYVDINKDDFNINPDSIKEAIEKNPSYNFNAILPAHLMGFPCNMKKINQIAKQNYLTVFEDSAQAHGTVYNKNKTGSIGHLGAFSFYIAHNIQAGELGAVTTDDDHLDKLIRKIKTNGRACDCKVCTRPMGNCVRKNTTDEDIDPRFAHDIVGYNFKTMEFQAALGLTQLRKVKEIIKKRQDNVKYLNDELNKCSDVLQLPKFSKDISYLAYPILIKDNSVISRKKLREELEKRNIETRPLFGCIPTQQEAYKNYKSKYEGKLPNAEYVGKNAFYIGCHQYLTKPELEYVAKMFKEVLK